MKNLSWAESKNSPLKLLRVNEFQAKLQIKTRLSVQMAQLIQQLIYTISHKNLNTKNNRITDYTITLLEESTH